MLLLHIAKELGGTLMTSEYCHFFCRPSTSSLGVYRGSGSETGASVDEHLHQFVASSLRGNVERYVAVHVRLIQVNLVSLLEIYGQTVVWRGPPLSTYLRRFLKKS